MINRSVGRSLGRKLTFTCPSPGTHLRDPERQAPNKFVDFGQEAT